MYFRWLIICAVVKSPPPAGTRRALQRLYVEHGNEVKPVIAAILRHPALYTGPRMVKPPAVYTAGLLRALGRGIDTEAWTSLLSLAGQPIRVEKRACRAWGQPCCEVHVEWTHSWSRRTRRPVSPRPRPALGGET